MSSDQIQFHGDVVRKSTSIQNPYVKFNVESRNNRGQTETDGQDQTLVSYTGGKRRNTSWREGVIVSEC